MPVDVLPDAREELRRANRRLEAARPDYGRRFTEAFTRAVRDIDRTPHAFPPHDDAPPGVEVRYVPLSRYNYQVVYVVLGELKLVAAVAHNSHDPGYWIDRLPPTA